MNRAALKALGLTVVFASVVAGYLLGHFAGVKARPRLGRTLTVWTPGSDMSGDAGPPVPPAEVYRSVLDKVQHDYVGTTAAVTGSSLTEGAIGRMLSSLDHSHTHYLNPTMRDARASALLGQFYGIGAVLFVSRTKKQDVEYRYLTVQSVLPGTPAERAGLQPGDRITEVDGHWVIAYTTLQDSSGTNLPAPESSSKAGRRSQDGSGITPGITASKATQILTSGYGALHAITVENDRSVEPRKLSIASAKTDVPGIQHRQLASGIEYLKINYINGDTGRAVDLALNDSTLSSNGLVIDLRECPGGVTADKGSVFDGYGTALSLIRKFASSGVIAQVEWRPGEREQLLSPGPPATHVTQGVGRLVVLVDAGTSNLSELIAACLRESAGATVLGSTTCGDGVLTRFTNLKAGSAIELASGHLYTASGKTIGAGVKPDRAVLRTPISDEPLNEALRTLNSVSLPRSTHQT